MQLGILSLSIQKVSYIVTVLTSRQKCVACAIEVRALCQRYYICANEVNSLIDLSQHHFSGDPNAYDEDRKLEICRD